MSSPVDTAALEEALPNVRKIKRIPVKLDWAVDKAKLVFVPACVEVDVDVRDKFTGIVEEVDERDKESS